MTARANDVWELSTEDLTLLALTVNESLRIRTAGVQQVFLQPVTPADGIDMVDPVKVEEVYGEGGINPSPALFAQVMEVFELQCLEHSLVAHAESSRAEEEIISDFVPESFEVQDEEVRKLHRWDLKHWSWSYQERYARLERLQALNAPQIILDHARGLLLEAAAGVAWQQAMALRASTEPPEEGS
jgi:hypothetical protein